ncbi:MAG: hypothetical protein U1E15_04850 [Hyphomicrobiales bacterium]
MELYPDIQVQLILEDEELISSMRQADVAIRLRRSSRHSPISSSAACSPCTITSSPPSIM